MVISKSDATIHSLIEAEIERAPALVRIAMPLARVEKPFITERFKKLAWVDAVLVKKNWIRGTIKISIIPRVAIARFEQVGVGPAEGRNRYLDEKLTIFSAPSKMSEESWTKKWGTLPTLYLQKNTESVRASVVFLMKEIAKNGSTQNQKTLHLLSIRTSAGGVLDSQVQLGDRTLEIGWGSNDKIAFKIQVLRALLLDSKNAKITRIDLTSPRSPIVSE